MTRAGLDDLDPQPGCHRAYTQPSYDCFVTAVAISRGVRRCRKRKSTMKCWPIPGTWSRNCQRESPSSKRAIQGTQCISCAPARWKLRDGKVIAAVGPKGIFGEMALIDGSPRSANAHARTDCSLVAVNERGFVFLVTETPYFAVNVMRTLAERLRAMNALI